MQKHAFYEKNELLIKDGSVKGRLAVLLVALTAAIGFTLLFSQPTTAYAKSYDMPEVTIDAVVEPDGDLRVTEQRAFDFNGDFTAVWWNYGNIPSGSTLSVEGVRMAHTDDEGNLQEGWTKLSSTPFQLKWREEGGPGTQAYSFDEPKNTVYVFFNESDSRIMVELTYVIKDAVQAYSDVGELYWKFIGSEWQEDASNIALTVSLPLPSGASVTPGENVRAWGHGPLDSTVTIKDDGTVVYQVPSISSGSYAEARVLFPTDWLVGVSAQDDNAHPSTARLDNALNEEQTWADRANAERAATLGLVIVVVLACLALLIWGLRSFVRYGKELEPTFTDEYWRDVPVAGEHPAVIGRLCRFDKESSSDFTATIMHLANKGALLINKGSYETEGLLGSKTIDDYYLTRVPEVELTLNSEIDRQAMQVLFDTIAEGEPSLWLGTIESFAQSNPQEFHNAMERWQGRVSSHTIAGEYFESYSKTKRTRMSTIAIILIMACAILGVAFSNPFVFAPGLVVGIALVVVSTFMERRTQKGADAYARCKALKKWLVEFSALNERPPSDVKVWGEFMVYAMILGVADEALRELRKAAPELLDPALSAGVWYSNVPWWIWYSSAYDSSVLSVGSAFDQAVSNSISTTASALSGGSSSGGGFGGGFSAGGGGGFGGGGGGAR